jgi:integrase
VPKRKKKHPEPFFRRFDGWWYVQIGKQQIKLARGEENETEAWRAYHRVMASRGPATPSAPFRDPTVTAVCNFFLDFSEKAHAPRTYEWYRDFLEDFCRFAGGLKVGELDAGHVQQWLDKHPDWKGARRGAIVALKRAFNYAHAERKIENNPLRNVKKPPVKARERFVTKGERKQIFENYKQGDPFRDFLFALEHTGARPGEVVAVTSEHVDLRAGVWQFDQHKTAGKTGETRVIILTPALVELTQTLLAKVPPGTPLFRDSKGNPWNRNSIRCRFRRVRRKLDLGDDLVAYLYRHATCTDLLEAGVPVAQTAELLGHKGVDMVMRHYSKLRDRRDHLRQQILKARGGDA